MSSSGGFYDRWCPREATHARHAPRPQANIQVSSSLPTRPQVDHPPGRELAETSAGGGRRGPARPPTRGGCVIRGKGGARHRGGSVGSSSRPETGLATSIRSSILESRHPRWAVPSRPSLLLRCLLLPFIEEGEMTNEGGGGLCVIHPTAPRRKQMDQAVKGIG